MDLIGPIIQTGLAFYLLLGGQSWGYILLRIGWPNIRPLENDYKRGWSLILGLITSAAVLILSAIVSIGNFTGFTLSELIIINVGILSITGLIIFTLKRKLLGARRVKVAVPKRVVTANIVAKKAITKLEQESIFKSITIPKIEIPAEITSAMEGIKSKTVIVTPSIGEAFHKSAELSRAKQLKPEVSQQVSKKSEPQLFEQIQSPLKETKPKIENVKTITFPPKTTPDKGLFENIGNIFKTKQKPHIEEAVNKFEYRQIHAKKDLLVPAVQVKPATEKFVGAPSPVALLQSPSTVAAPVKKIEPLQKPVAKPFFASKPQVAEQNKFAFKGIERGKIWGEKDVFSKPVQITNQPQTVLQKPFEKPVLQKAEKIAEKPVISQKKPSFFSALFAPKPREVGRQAARREVYKKSAEQKPVIEQRPAAQPKFYQKPAQKFILPKYNAGPDVPEQPKDRKSVDDIISLIGRKVEENKNTNVFTDEQIRQEVEATKQFIRTNLKEKIAQDDIEKKEEQVAAQRVPAEPQPQVQEQIQSEALPKSARLLKELLKDDKGE